MNLNFDVIVIGGGSAGICAAIQSARIGAKTLLVDRSSRLGGTTVNALVDFPGLFHAWGRQIIAGIGWELVTRCCRESGSSLPDFTRPAEKHMAHQIRLSAPLYSLLVAESVCQSGVETLLQAMPANVRESDDRVELTLCTKTGLQVISACFVIDCTGDANALSLAGCELRVPTQMQPGTLSCYASGYDIAALDQDALEEAARKACVNGELFPSDLSYSPSCPHPLTWLIHHGNNSNHIYRINAIGSEGRSQMEAEAVASLLRAYRFFRKQPGLELLTLEALAAECGVRETATFVGRDMITVDDYLSGKVWPDALCYSYYPVDLHDEKSGLENRELAHGTVPTVGRGAMLPVNRQRLLGAGRCISSDRLANSALRVQASCMAMGQAAGCLAALAALGKTLPDLLKLEEIRQTLTAHKAIVPELPDAVRT